MMSAAKMQREKAVRGAEVTQTRLLPDTASVSHLHSLVPGVSPRCSYGNLTQHF